MFRVRRCATINPHGSCCSIEISLELYWLIDVTVMLELRVEFGTEGPFNWARIVQVNRHRSIITGFSVRRTMSMGSKARAVSFCNCFGHGFYYDKKRKFIFFYLNAKNRFGRNWLIFYRFLSGQCCLTRFNLRIIFYVPNIFLLSCSMR